MSVNSASVFYFIVIFIGGVAFSISHAIIPAEQVGNIKYFVEVKTKPKNQ